MIRRILCIVLAFLALACTASAEPRYPERSGVVTDSAGVLSDNTLEDLHSLDDRLDDADLPHIIVVTVDFLDASPIQDYADALFDRWHLNEDEMLLLISVGEECYATVCGSDAAALLPRETLDALLASTFRELFLEQRYDAALGAFMTALTQELCAACRVSIRTDDLFRSASTSLIANWASLLPTTDKLTEAGTILTREDRASGFSLLKVIVIIVLLLLIFGSFRRGRRARHPYAPNTGRKGSPPSGVRHR